MKKIGGADEEIRFGPGRGHDKRAGDHFRPRGADSRNDTARIYTVLSEAGLGRARSHGNMG